MIGLERGLAMDKRWFILGVIFVARTAMSFQFQSVGSAAPKLIETFGIGYAALGTLVGLYMVPGVALALPGGLLGRRFGDKAVCCFALAVMTAGGMLIAVADGYGTAVVGRVLSGAGAVLLSLIVTKMTTDWFAGREIVTAMGIMVSSWPFGIAAGLVLQPPLAAAFGWPAVMIAGAGVCGAGLVLVAAFYRARPGAAAGSGSRAALALPPTREALPCLVAGAIWGVFNVGIVLFFTFGPLLMVENGAETLGAAKLTSAALWVMLASVPLGGYLVQRSGRPDLAIVLSTALAALALAAIQVPQLAPALCFVIGVCVGPPAGAIFSLPGRVLSPENRATGIGLFMTTFYAFNAAGPWLAGALRDATGSAVAPVMLGAAMFAASTPLLIVFHRASRTVLAARRVAVA
jgi:predicted MFS family arabinose efflux permease